jgi:hypothetical protein
MNITGECSGPEFDAICLCHGGYVGDDCADVLCPHADDPFTSDQEDRSIAISVVHSYDDGDASQVPVRLR